MTLQETITILYLARSLFPRDKSLNRSDDDLMDMAKAWASLLQDIPFEVGQAAVAAHAAGSPFAPAISEIRAYAKKLTEPPRLSADEAWALARQAISRYGASPYKSFTTGKYPYEMARESLPPDVWRVMELMGYANMCRSDKPEVIRSQFIAAFERQQQRQQEREDLLPFLPEGLKEQYLSLTEGPAAG